MRLPQAEVIASLWSGIIAENLDIYATPGGLASPEAETIFLCYTSGLPGTCPVGGQPGEAAELAAWAAVLGLEAGDLDDLVHDAHIRQASRTNSGGLLPASSACCFACCQAGGRLKPVTGDSPPLESGSP